MATRRTLKQISALKKTRRFRDRIRQNQRKMQLEQLEDRRVMATTGPTLVNVLSNFGPVANDSTVSIAPREITLRFAEGQSIDPTSIAGGVQITRAGLDDQFGTPDDVVIQPGYSGLTDSPREIIIRFADHLPDDLYRIELIGAGATPLRDTAGNAVNGGVNVTHNFNLDLGAQIIAIVPQPITRNPITGSLSQNNRQIEVYFNPDRMDPTSVSNPAYYKLINTANGNIVLPQTVQYTAVDPTSTTPGEYKATLTFATDIPGGTFKLVAGVTDEPNNSSATAIHVGGPVDSSENLKFATLYLGDNPNLVTQSADVDFYRIDIRTAISPATDPFVARVTGGPGFNAALRLFNSAGVQVGPTFDATTSGVETLTLDTLPAGTYYLGVSSSGNISYLADGSGAVPGTSTGGYRLDIEFDNAAPLENAGNDSSFGTAGNLGVIGSAGQTISGYLAPQFYNIAWPGTSDDPGHRDLPPAETGEEHLNGGPDGVQGIQVITYNFPAIYGSTPQGNTLFNAITDNQKQRAREIFELYGRYLGVKFVETPEDGSAALGVVTGDMRAIDPTIPTGSGGVAGLAGSGLAIMDNAEAWGNSEYGGAWFNVALHEIGHLLGLGHSYDLPALTIQGSAETPDTTPGAQNPAEPVFPGDHDILHGQTLYRPEGRDIDLYKFQLTEAGRFSAETIAERLPNRTAADLREANTVITLYREYMDNGQLVREIVAKNDDYYSSDSFLELDLTAGTYYVSVTSTGMTGVDPTVLDSGFGGTTDGAYELKLNFVPAARPGMKDATGTELDGDLDGRAGGAYEFFFQSNSVPGSTIYVDKATTAATETGALNAPYNTIQEAIAVAAPGQIIRIVGNGGTDRTLGTLGDNLPYVIGYDDFNEELADGNDFLVPEGVTVMIDAGAILKFQRANIDAGTSTQGISRAGGVIQILGTPVHNVHLTSFSNDTIGGDTDGPGITAAAGDWGGIVFREDSDREDENIFLNYVNHANISYGGGKVVVNSSEELFTPIHVITARPTITFNRITFSADAAMSANPDSFQDTIATSGPISVAGAESRIGPEIYGNTVILNSFNGLFVRIRTEFGSPVDVLSTFARFDDTDIVHLITENLHIDGTPGGAFMDEFGNITARTDARLRIDPGVIVKFEGTRIEARVGSQLIVEGSDAQPVILTSLYDDKYGAGGTFDTSNDGAVSAPQAGNWGGLMFNANSVGSIDRARIFYAGGETPIEGDFATFNPVEVHQADVRIAKSVFQFNDDGTGRGGNRNGRGSNGPATIFVRGAQPIIVDNIIRDNAGHIISINANSMQATVQADYGRSTGLADAGLVLRRNYDAYTTLGDNFGPLVRLNRIVNNGTNGMEVRGGVLTTESIWDDTDIAHVLRDQITILNHHTFSGLRLQSSVAESLVVKLFGQDAGFYVNGVPMEITDRIGGTLHIVGQPNRPVVLTSLADDTVPAGLQPITGLPLFDTNNNGNATTPQPGDWNSITLDQYSNDRNVAIVLETEPAYIGAANDPNTGRPLGDQNRVPLTQAQNLGNLAPNEKSGDDNRRLGFEVQGFIALDNAHDVDVYSFTGDGGTEVWFDIDRTSYGLNVVLELVNGNGTVLARSTDNDTLSGLAQTFQKDPHLGRDFYGTNPNDASMRVVLPGTEKGVRWFVRVRSEGTPANINNINAGLSRGEYRLQVRVRQVDNKPGSTVRYSDIRYATNGIEVIGLPYHSPLAGESTESTTPNDAFANAQYLGNLLTSDRGTISVAGSLSGAGDIDFYSFDLDYDFLQVIGDVSDAAKTISAMFDIDYADGLSRPDTTISVFNDAGQLIYIGRDSDIADDQPGAGQGLDADDLARGSFGKLDPYIGTAQLPAGSAGTAGLPNPQTRRYYVAISSNRRLPTALNAQFQANAASPLIRLEPINSVRRIVEDHIGYTNGSGLAQGAGARLIDITNIQTLATHINTFNLSDAVLFTTSGDGVRQVDPFTGDTEVGQYGGMSEIRDLVMRNDGRLFGYRYVLNNNTTAGQLVELDPTTNSWISRGNDGIADPPQGNTDIDLIGAPDVGALAFTGNNYTSAYELYFAVTSNAALGGSVSYLYRADPNTGNVRDGTGPLGRRVQPITAATASSGVANFGVSRVGFVSNTPGTAGDGISINITQDTLGAGQPVFVDVDNTAPATPIINITLNTDVSTAQAAMTVGSVNFQFVADNPGPAGNNIQLVITKQANVANGASVSVNGSTINIVLDSANVTAQQLATALNNNAAASALINVSFTGDPAANIGPGAAAGTIQLAGGSPSSAQDIIRAIQNHPLASSLVTATLTQGNGAAAVTGPGATQQFNLTGGTGTISATTGMAHLDGVMYGVSANGGFYRISLSSGAATPITTFPGVSFTGLTVGPQNLNSGAYSNLLFATTSNGQLMAFDTNGVVQAIFENDATSVSIAGSAGLAFSPLDFNLWHPTLYRRLEAGHGVNAAPDNSRGATEGGTSMYFGFEPWNQAGNTYYTYGGPNGNLNRQMGIMEEQFQRSLSTNPTIPNTYNFLGGAKGSLVTDGFSLAGYSRTDKPTFYFNYWLQTEDRNDNEGRMRDSARVYVSRDNGVTWELIATNNAVLDDPQTTSLEGELTTFKSTSGSELPGNERQDIQELYDVGSWRQARVDLSDYAGASNLKFRFDFSTSGVTGAAAFEDSFGDDSHPERGARNQFGGFAIDDLIVGFAERGEMATGASAGLTTFFAQPAPVAPAHLAPTPNEVLAGSYQLEIRRGGDHGWNGSAGSPAIGLGYTYDTNTRLVQDVREAAPLPVQDFETGVFSNLRWAHFHEAPWTVVEYAPGEFRAESGGIGDNEASTLELTADVGAGTITFDWGVDAAFGDRLEFYIDGQLRSLITGLNPGQQVSFPVTAGVHNFRWHFVKDDAGASGGDRGWIDNVTFSNGAQVGSGTRGDENQWRDQGHIQIEQNLITDSLLVGILVDAAPRNIAGNNLPFQGSVRKLTVPNVDNLVPGVAIVNNTIGGYGTAGIRFSGDPNVAGQPVAASPFGRILNNTVYGGLTPTGVGIQITDNAAPTVLNNIIANAAVGIGIDNSTAQQKTVVGFNLFQGNISDGTRGSDALVLAANEPLFVNPSTRNFYLASGSRAIDSSLNSLGERPSYRAVIRELGIPDSPILAPEYDMYGQKRLDDTTQNPTPGQGNQIVKDRGAIERADFIGSFVNLIHPLDNDGDGLDRNTDLNDVVISGTPPIPRFVLKLRDTGIGIDDLAVNPDQFVLTENGVPLVLGTDYSFIYNPNTDEVTFLPASGTWNDESLYVITVDNTVATGVKDLAGNTILPNRQDGSTIFTIYIGTPYDYSDLPDTYQIARHLLASDLYLGQGVSAEPGPQPVGLDDDDGLAGGLAGLELNPGLTSTMNILALMDGHLDVWIDLNGDGDFDVDEYIADASGAITGSPTAQTVTFTMPAATLGASALRLRYSSAGISSPSDEAPDGEVEDYAITISGSPFQNPADDGENDAFSRDVNGDGFITALDALIVINFLNQLGPIYPSNLYPNGIPLPNAELPDAGTVPNARYVDVDGDRFLTNFDALVIITWLNDNPIGPSGEGEGYASSIPTTTYASSSIVIEEKESVVDAGLVADEFFAADSGLAPVDNDSWNSDELFNVLGENEDQEDDLIAILAYNLEDGDDA